MDSERVTLLYITLHTFRSIIDITQHRQSQARKQLICTAIQSVMYIISKYVV